MMLFLVTMWSICPLANNNNELISVPLNTILMRIIGVRRITIIGTVLNLVGVFPAAFVTKVWHLLLCYGVVASESFMYITDIT